MTEAIVCRQTLFTHGRSFSLASTWLGDRQRDDVAALYTWCRRADDAIDLPGDLSPARVLAALREELADVYGGAAQRDAANAAFQRTVHERQIPFEYPSALLAGLEMDVSGVRCEDMYALLSYCHGVAGTVGLMMSHVLGVSDDRALIHAAHLGIAMQLTNISRDVYEDWQRGRLYIPREILAAVGGASLTEEVGDPLSTEGRKALARATDRLLSEAERWYASGDRGLHALSFRAALAIRCARRLYARIGHHVKRQGSDPLAGRAVVPLVEKIALVATSLGRPLFELPSRALQPHRAIAIHRVVRFPDDVLCV